MTEVVRLRHARHISVDVIRTWAIVQMVVFHFIFDLGMFGYHQWQIPDGFGWRHWRYVIVTMFLLCVGIGLVFAHASDVRWSKFWRRLIWIALSAATVSGMTALSHPAQWVYFGVLHFIAVASLLSLPLVQRPRLALLAGCAMVAGTLFGLVSPRWPYYVICPQLPMHPVDFVPLFPWLSAVWFGIWLAHTRWFQSDPLGRWTLPAFLMLPGRHSLLVYMAHQPILVGALAAIDYFWN